MRTWRNNRAWPEDIIDLLLKDAFRAAVYRVYLPRGYIDLRVGDDRNTRRLRARLSPRPHTDAWIVTACNPGGRRAAPWTNARRRRQLIRLLNQRAIAWRPAVNLDPAGHWPDEPGACVWNLNERDARNLGRRFGQAALLRIPRRGAAELFWV